MGVCPVATVRLVLQCTNHPLEANSSRLGRLVAFPRLGNRRYCRNIGSSHLCPSMEREFESVLGMQRVQQPANRTHGLPRLALGTAKAARVHEQRWSMRGLRYTGNGTEAGSAANMPR